MAERDGLVGRVLLVVLIAYVVLDFANPLFPGAVNFDDDQTILAAGRPEHRNAEPPSLRVDLVRSMEAPRLACAMSQRPATRVAPPRLPPLSVRPRYATAARSPEAPDDH